MDTNYSAVSGHNSTISSSFHLFHGCVQYNNNLMVGLLSWNLFGAFVVVCNFIIRNHDDGYSVYFLQ